MIGFDLGGIVKTVGGVLDKLFTSDEERLKAQEALLKISQELPKAQIELNAQEAKHASVFVAGWRPFLGWGIGAMFMLGSFMDVFIRPLLSIWNIHMVTVDMSILTPILMGMLGMSAFRSFDKLKNIDTPRIRPMPYFTKMFFAF